MLVRVLLHGAIGVVVAATAVAVVVVAVVVVVVVVHHSPGSKCELSSDTMDLITSDCRAIRSRKEWKVIQSYRVSQQSELKVQANFYFRDVVRLDTCFDSPRFLCAFCHWCVYQGYHMALNRERFLRCPQAFILEQLANNRKYRANRSAGAAVVRAANVDYPLT